MDAEIAPHVARARRVAHDPSLRPEHRILLRALLAGDLEAESVLKRSGRLLRMLRHPGSVGLDQRKFVI